MNKIYKKILLFFFFFLLFASCINKKKNRIDLTSSSTDTTNQIIKREKTIFKIDTLSFKATQNCNTEFNYFFERFSRDSMFQKSRVKYPLRWSYYSGNYDKLQVEMINHQEFSYFDFENDVNAKGKKQGAFEVGMSISKDKVVYQRTGIDTGLLMSFQFKLINGCWFLVEILDEST
jgi:hypothetical protein